MTVFYDHILPHAIARESLTAFLTSEAEIEQVLVELDELYHHVVLEHILHALPEHAHGDFIGRLRKNPADHALLLMIRSYDPHIEAKLSQAALKSTHTFIDAIHA